MNILCFCANTVNGGTAKMFYELTSILQKNCVEHKVVGSVDSENTVEIYRNMNELRRIPVYSEEYICKGLYGGNIILRIIKRFLRKWKYKVTEKKNIKTMRKFLHDEKIECVLIHNGGYIGDELCNQMLEAAYKENIKRRIYILHNCTTKKIMFQIRFLLYDRKVSKEATDIVTVSEFTKNRIKKISHITKEIHVIPNGLSDTVRRVHMEEKICKMGLDRGKKNVLMIGNFLKNKGQMEFLKAAVLVVEHISDVKFTIIGNIYDEEYYNSCMEYANENQINDKVQVFEELNNASDYVGAFDIVAVPSMFSESFGLISVEAMMNGVPVVAFGCGGISEVVKDGQNGYVVPVGDYRKMADKMIELLLNEDKRRKISENCRKDYELKFSPESMEKCYKNIIFG